MQRLQRLQQLLAQEQLDALLITNATNRRYMTGFTGTAGFALVTPHTAHLITDFRYVSQAGEQAPQYEIVEHRESIFKSVAELCAKLKVETLAFEAPHTTYQQYEELRERTAQVTLKATSGLVEQLRIVKDENELQIIEQAAAIADRTYAHMLTVLRPGITERDVALEIEFFMRKQGATSSSFDTIVASGARGALPHGVASDKRIESGDLVTMDFGALYNGYCSDITRTVAVGEPSAKQRELYAIVLEAQLRGVAGLKPGITGREADALARDVIKAKGYGEYFGHSTGHGLGMEVHEEPRLAAKSDTVLRAGMVVTVEPGIYLDSFGGVRIEDDVVITETGARRLTKSDKQLTVL